MNFYNKRDFKSPITFSIRISSKKNEELMISMHNLAATVILNAYNETGHKGYQSI